MKKDKVRYYSSFDEDFEQSRQQDFKLPEDYKWIRKDVLSKLLSGLIYTLAVIFSSVYCRLFLHLRFKNKQVLKPAVRSGGFIYCNHTQPIGDVFDPALALLPNRIYTVVSPANYGIPVIGKILPYLGALPIPDTVKGMKELNRAIEERIKQKRPVVIYPEAHVWEYYTGIRPFPDTAFKYPVKLSAPVFVLTSTYKKRKSGRRPKLIIYADGPFYPDREKSAKEQSEELRNKVFECMKKRSRESDCEYIVYLPEKPAMTPEPEN